MYIIFLHCYNYTFQHNVLFQKKVLVLRNKLSFDVITFKKKLLAFIKHT